jgi:putative membrane protein
MLSGDAFDRAFGNGMVTDHQSDIKEFRKEALKDDRAGAFAKESLPTLQNHVQAAQSLTQ